MSPLASRSAAHVHLLHYHPVRPDQAGPAAPEHWHVAINDICVRRYKSTAPEFELLRYPEPPIQAGSSVLRRSALHPPFQPDI
eukprot:1343311-Rhodomonas_salina.4